MKRILALLLTALLALSPALTLAEDAEVKVTGSAVVRVPADSAVISLGLETIAPTAAAAIQANALQVDEVLAALRRVGVSEADVVTQRYYVSVVRDYNQYNDQGSPVLRGYMVSNGLNVTVRAIDDVGAVIDAALTAGASECNNIMFQSAQAAQAADDALVLAIEEAERKARLIAAARGMTLGRLESVTENPDTYFATTAADKREAPAANAVTRIIADELSFSATVTLVFELAPAN